MFATDKRIYPTALRTSSMTVLIGCFLLFLAVIIPQNFSIVFVVIILYSPFSTCMSLDTAAPACCWPTACLSSTFRSGWATATSPPRRTSTPIWITSLKSPRHRRWRQGLLYRRAATSEVGGDRLMLGRTDDFLSEKVKEHGIARFGKRKEPVIGLITGS